MQEIIDRAIKHGWGYIGYGKPAAYIPELSKVNPNQLGISVIQINGENWNSGDYEAKFTIQSISKTVALIMAVVDRGADYVFAKVGMEPTGDAFNSIIKLETIKTAKPLNPMINAGAIAIDSMIQGESIDKKFERVLDMFRRLCHNHSIGNSEQVYNSEKATGFRNRALAHFMKDSGIIEGEVEEVLDLYFKQCSVEVTCKDIAMLGAVLAGDGVSPVTGERLLPRSLTRLVKTFMVTCGMYDASGEFAIRVGLPAKSGVGGGIMASVPGKMGIGVYGPALDEKGNSIGGIKTLEYLSNEMDLSIF